MVIEVKRQFIPINTYASQWEMSQFERVVWRHRGGDAEPEAWPIAAPDDYVAGLLMPYIDGRRVDYHDLDEALKPLGLTRADIKAVIR